MKKRIISILLVSVLAASLFAGCGSQKESQGEGAQSVDREQTAEKEFTIKIATPSTRVFANPLNAIANAKGYFDELNVKTEEITVDGMAQFESLSVGKVDTTYGQLVPPLSYGAKGSDVTLFGGTVSGGMVCVSTKDNSEELKDAKNWKGKKIGVIQGATSEMVVRYALEKNYGYESGDEIEFVFIEDYPTIIIATQKGTVDIGFVGAANVEAANAAGLELLFPLTDLREGYVCCRQTAYAPSLEGNRDGYVNYLKGQLKAYKDYKNNQDEVVDIVTEGSGETKEKIQGLLYDADVNANQSYNPDPNYNGTLEVYQTLLKWKYIEKGGELSEFFDISIYADALKEIIEENPDDEFYKEVWNFFLENNSEYPQFSDTYNDSFLTS